MLRNMYVLQLVISIRLHMVIDVHNKIDPRANRNKCRRNAWLKPMNVDVKAVQGVVGLPQPIGKVGFVSFSDSSSLSLPPLFLQVFFFFFLLISLPVVMISVFFCWFLVGGGGSRSSV